MLILVLGSTIAAALLYIFVADGVAAYRRGTNARRATELSLASFGSTRVHVPAQANEQADLELIPGT